jgi:hypothetical protein
MSADPPESDLPAGIGRPAHRALAAARYTRLDHLAGRSARELLKLHGMGPKAVGRIRAALAERRQSLAD